MRLISLDIKFFMKVYYQPVTYRMRHLAVLKTQTHVSHVFCFALKFDILVPVSYGEISLSLTLCHKSDKISIGNMKHANPTGAHQAIVWPKFAETCMKIGRGRGTRPKFYYVDPFIGGS